MIERYCGTNTTIGGFINVLSNAGVEIVPILMASAGAAGSASDAAFVHYVDRMCEGLSQAGALDGVLLTWSGGTWTAVEAPRLAGSASGNPETVLGVSCPSASFCVAGGQDEETSGAYEGLLLTWSLVLGEFTIAYLLLYTNLQVELYSISRNTPNAGVLFSTSFAALLFAFALLMILSYVGRRRRGRG